MNAAPPGAEDGLQYAAMRPRGLVLSLLVYVLLDFSNPLIPGAVTFNPEDCTDGIRTSWGSGSLRAQFSAPAPPRDLDVPDRARRVVPTSRITRMKRESHPWLVKVWRPHAIPGEPSSPTEDH